MDTTNPHYLSGFVKEAVAAGLSIDTTCRLVKRAHDIHLVNDPAFVRGFRKEAEAGLLDSLKTGWEGLSPEAKGGIAGAGIGGVGGLLFGGEHRVRNALLGAAGGGAAGYGLGHVLGGVHEDQHGTNGPETGAETAASRDEFLRRNSPGVMDSTERAQLLQTINNKTAPIADQIAAAQRLQAMEPANHQLGVGAALADTAADYGKDTVGAAKDIAHGVAASGTTAAGLPGLGAGAVPHDPIHDFSGNPTLPPNATPEQQQAYIDAVRQFHGQ